MFEGLRIDHSSTTDRVVEAVRASLFEGRLRPGASLRELELAETLSVSRGTVREALRVLVAEGLLTRSPNRGVMVKVLEPDDIDDLYRAREILEGGALGARGFDPARLAILDRALAFYEAALATGDNRAMTDTHLRFHEAVIGLSGSERLQALGRVLLAEVRLAFAAADRRSRDAGEQLAEHRHLVELIRRDPQAARVELARHLHAGALALAAASEGSHSPLG